MMGLWNAVLVAVSLCADCFAVSLCSSVTLKSLRPGKVASVALAFAVIQSALILAGWLFGSLLAGVISRLSHLVGFILLLYVGGGMLIGGLKEECEIRNLNGLRNVILGGIATSIDAMAVGMAQSMMHQPWNDFSVLLAAVFVVTFVSVVSGMYGGKALGCRFGKWAEIIGGLVLVGIGVNILFS